MRPLNCDEVVRVALDLLDEVGPSGFTMRAVATRLDTYPAPVYWHVGNRNRLLAREAASAGTGPELISAHQIMTVRSKTFRRVVKSGGRTAPAREDIVSSSRGRPQARGHHHVGARSAEWHHN